MTAQPCVGLLPLYLKLYDEALPGLREQFDPFLAQVTAGFESDGIRVVPTGVCRLEPEVAEAVALCEREDVDLIVTVHLAYSPSLEAVGPLCDMARPILMLDTTMDYDFGPGVAPERIMFDHGVHGVQDLASMLRRRGKPYEIVAGHVTESCVLKRAAGMARAAFGAHRLRDARVLRIGETFRGMGDFAVSEDLLHSVLGATVHQATIEDLGREVERVSPIEIERELALDRARFATDLPDEVHRRSVRVGLGLRRLLAQDNHTAFSMNFLAFDSSDGPVDTVPFLEASKAMGRGLGYAGEGDVLTAVLVGALNSAFGKTTFTEIFCPDWRGQSLFLSHMGEVNPEIAAEQPRLCEKSFPWTRANNPAVIACAPAPGPAVFVNLAPGPDETFGLIVAPVEVLADAAHPGMRDWVRGWIRPFGPLESFLERYSRLGGTHHSALVLGDYAEAIAAFARFAALGSTVI